MKKGRGRKPPPEKSPAATEKRFELDGALRLPKKCEPLTSMNAVSWLP